MGLRGCISIDVSMLPVEIPSNGGERNFPDKINSSVHVGVPITCRTENNNSRVIFPKYELFHNPVCWHRNLALAPSRGCEFDTVLHR